jgi:hypothetical protein
MSDFPPWFKSHHDSVHSRFDRQDATLQLILNNTERLIKMGETTDQALSEVTALAQANSAALAKLKTDVAAALAAIQGSGTLNAEQQASVDALKASLSADAATIAEIDQSTQPAAPASP